MSEMSPPQLLHLARDCLSSFLCSGVVVHAFGWLYQVDDLKKALRLELVSFASLELSIVSCFAEGR